MTENKMEPRSPRTTHIAIAIVGMMFFIFGFVSWVNAILIPYFRIACELTNFQSYLVTFAFYIAYFVMSLPASLVLKRFGFKRGIMYGFFCMATGAFLFVPAALGRTYWVFLTGLFCLGSGLTLLQAAANPYITIVGPIESAARRISIMGICNKFAGIIAPLIFAAIILKTSDSALFEQLEAGTLSAIEKDALLDELIQRVIAPYSILGCLLIVIGLFIRYSVLPEINQEEENKETDTDSGKKHTSILQFPYLLLGAFAMFLHVGTQVIAIDTIIGYADSMGIDLLEAKVFPSYTLTATIIGYSLGILLIPKIVSQKRMFQFCCILGLLLSLGVVLSNVDLTLFGHEAGLSIWFLVLLGLPNSLIYAGIWPLSIRGLGRFTKTGSSLLVMGLCGNAILPLIYGHFADIFSVKEAYWILVPCYCYLIFFSLYGYKIKSWSLKKK